MNLESFVIRKSISNLYCNVIIAGIIFLWYFVFPNDDTSKLYSNSPLFTVVLGVIFGILLLFFLGELIKHEPEIILTSEGI